MGTGRTGRTGWEWHHAYDDPSIVLSRRLEVARVGLGQALDARPEEPAPRILSRCAGEGRDVLAVLAARRRGSSSSVLLVERDSVLAKRAVERAPAASLSRVEVRCADAADLQAFADFLPVDILLLCGIFGNIDPEDIRVTIAAVPRMVVAGGTVL